MKKQTIHLGKKSVKITPGGLHKSLHVPADKKIPAKKFKAALEGKYGKKAQKQAQFKKNVLHGKKKKS